MRTSQPPNLRLIRGSDISAKVRLEELVLHHLDALYRTSLRLTKSRPDAEDLLQETLLKALKNFDQLQDRTKARAWLFQILVNTFYNIQSKRKREASLVDVELNEDLVASSLGAPQYNPLEVFTRLMSDEVEKALNDLHPAFKTVLLLHDVEGLSYDEIAEACRCSKGTVGSRLYRAREVLRTNLEAFAREHGYL